MKKVKEWLKKHKKEIIVGVAAAGCTALYFLAKQKNVGVKASLNVMLRFLDGEDDEQYGYHKNDVYSSINLNKPDLSMEDLGKLGDILKNSFPNMAAGTKLAHISANYSETSK